MDSYTISMSPNFGILGPSPIRSIFESNYSKSNYGVDVRSLLLANFEANNQKDDPARMSRLHSAVSARSTSIYSQATGEFPISYGCSFTQTVFNGKSNNTIGINLYIAIGM